MMDREDRKLELISEEAAEWFVRIKDRDLDPQGQREYVRWLKGSPLHVAEFLRVSQNYVKYKKAGIPTPESDENGASNIIELKSHENKLSISRVTNRAEVATWKIAATIATVACSLLFGGIAKIAWHDRTIETGVGEWRQVALTDGSTVRVAPLTTVTVAFSDHRRTIDLLQGQAFFQVAKDKKRPFFVNGGYATVRAVGTQFAVSRAKGDIVITVSEGEVAVALTEAPEPSKTLTGSEMLSSFAELPVSANQQVKISQRVWPTAPRRVNASRELAWTRQQLIFETETIAEAAEQFNRLNRIQIAVDDPEIRQWQVCCAFNATDPESFAESMAKDPGIALVRDPLGTLHLVAERAAEEDGAEESKTIQADAF